MRKSLKIAASIFAASFLFFGNPNLAQVSAAYQGEFVAAPSF